MAAAVEFDNVTRRFGEIAAVDGIDLSIDEGVFFAMLGPSGSGKTTCLRLISGFEQPTEGHVRIFGANSERIPPNARPVNTVFQDYALFPHLSVRDNIAFGPMVRGVSKRNRYAEASRALDMVALTGFDLRSPRQLSGGQRQRVALARALVNKPRVLLLDEPLGALDLRLREQMQDELKALQKSLGITFIFVTHDQGEALSMSDRLAVVNRGKIVQVGTPEEIYSRPKSKFVADFVGASNVLSPELSARSGGAPAWSSLRPEFVRISRGGHANLSGKIRAVKYLGATRRVTVDVGGAEITALVEANSPLPSPDSPVGLSWSPEALHAMESE